MDTALPEIPEKRLFGTCLSDSWADFINGFCFDLFSDPDLQGFQAAGMTRISRSTPFSHPEAADKLWRKFVNDLNRTLYGRHGTWDLWCRKLLNLSGSGRIRLEAAPASNDWRSGHIAKLLEQKEDRQAAID